LVPETVSKVKGSEEENSSERTNKGNVPEDEDKMLNGSVLGMSDSH
jgi:hypothetical protein